MIPDVSNVLTAEAIFPILAPFVANHLVTMRYFPPSLTSFAPFSVFPVLGNLAVPTFTEETCHLLWNGCGCGYGYEMKIVELKKRNREN